jgi:hypothetical protein
MILILHQTCNSNTSCHTPPVRIVWRVERWWLTGGTLGRWQYSHAVLFKNNCPSKAAYGGEAEEGHEAGTSLQHGAGTYGSREFFSLTSCPFALTRPQMSEVLKEECKDNLKYYGIAGRNSKVTCPICYGNRTFSNEGKAKRGHRATMLHNKAWNLRRAEWRYTFTEWAPLFRDAAGAPNLSAPLVEDAATDDNITAPLVLAQPPAPAPVTVLASLVPDAEKDTAGYHHASKKRKADESSAGLFTASHTTVSSSRDPRMAWKRPRTDNTDSFLAETLDATADGPAESSGSQAQLYSSGSDGSPPLSPSPDLDSFNEGELDDDDEDDELEEVKIPLLMPSDRPSSVVPPALTPLIITFKTLEEVAQGQDVRPSSQSTAAHDEGDEAELNAGEHDFIGDLWDEVPASDRASVLYSESQSDPGSGSGSDSGSDSDSG